MPESATRILSIDSIVKVAGTLSELAFTTVDGLEWDPQFQCVFIEVRVLPAVDSCFWVGQRRSKRVFLHLATLVCHLHLTCISLASCHLSLQARFCNPPYSLGRG